MDGYRIIECRTCHGRSQFVRFPDGSLMRWDLWMEIGAPADILLSNTTTEEVVSLEYANA